MTAAETTRAEPNREMSTSRRPGSNFQSKEANRSRGSLIVVVAKRLWRRRVFDVLGAEHLQRVAMNEVLDRIIADVPKYEFAIVIATGRGDAAFVEYVHRAAKAWRPIGVAKIPWKRPFVGKLQGRKPSVNSIVRATKTTNDAVHPRDGTARR